ncbi:helix-turn-helix domain-containing protein [Paenibacillus tundrae]|uniref:helix-turn-helix domain-containing protein n=1 Tax=Paenibacillus tundrae TaxID=528187 RepID=UPI0022A9E224|nr:helix-turn-helix transcriptional regulator [Paenibacillus tundrae]MCZ1268965.1 XRE family transcriptional regulator [Paenibacillus tundrae]
MNEIRLGAFLKQKRLESGFKTQKELADFTLLVQGHISRIESSDTSPNDGTLMILAMALDLNYRDLFEKTRTLSEVEIIHFQEQEKIDKELIELLKRIFRLIYENDDNDSVLKSKLLSIFKTERIGNIQSNVKNRIERVQNRVKQTQLEGHLVFDTTYDYYSKREAVMVFYHYVRYFSDNHRKSLLDKLDGIEEHETMESKPDQVIDLANDSFQFSIHGQLLSEKEVYAIIEHYSTTKRVEVMFKSVQD